MGVLEPKADVPTGTGRKRLAFANLGETKTVDSIGGDYSTGGDVPSSDGSLLKRYQRGDDDAASALYRRYASRMLRLARARTGHDLSPRFDAEDVVQSVFRTFFRRASQGLYAVPPGEELWSLLLTLALNKIRRLAIHHHAQKRDARQTVATEQLAPDFSEQATDDELAYQMLKSVVDTVVAHLPEVQQRIIMDRIDGYETAEIAARHKRSKRTVERTLQQFRESLRKHISDGEHEE